MNKLCPHLEPKRPGPERRRVRGTWSVYTEPAVVGRREVLQFLFLYGSAPPADVIGGLQDDTEPTGVKRVGAC